VVWRARHGSPHADPFTKKCFMPPDPSGQPRNIMHQLAFIDFSHKAWRDDPRI